MHGYDNREIRNRSQRGSVISIRGCSANIVDSGKSRSAKSLHEYEQPLNFARYAPVPLQFYYGEWPARALDFFTVCGK
ncbi:hypothetical protein X971_2174 [Agrobacterium tumefaciens LBA4213 (Ach5)]|nr:hypothetical protein X971_2174 [Agrobacterium tumefaciens LBA4213 (Ach5)]